MRYRLLSAPPAQTYIQYRPSWWITCGAHSWVSPSVGSVDRANGCLVHGPNSDGAVAWARCSSSNGCIGSACGDADEVPQARWSRMKVWSLMYQGPSSPTDGS